MGLFRKNNERQHTLNLSFLLVPLVIILLICTIVGVCVWVWNTVEEQKEEIVEKAFMDSFTLTVPGYAEYQSTNIYYEVSLSFVETELDGEKILEEVQALGFRPTSCEDNLYYNGEKFSGVVKLNLRDIPDNLTPDVLETVFYRLADISKVDINIIRRIAAVDENRTMQLAIEDAKERGGRYLKEFWQIDDGIITNIEAIKVEYDKKTGVNRCTLNATIKTGEQDNV